MERCSWSTADATYMQYHDTEWGVPQMDSVALFEKICLEGQQAGLSWITVLKKRKNYQKRFYHFDPEKITQMSSEDIDELMKDSGLIRHRGKLESIVNNANVYLSMKENGEDFSEFVWSFVDNKIIVNKWMCLDQIPTKTSISDEMSKVMKKRGFKFVGTTICYAFMSACGLVNNHLTTCFCHPDNIRVERKWKQFSERISAIKYKDK